MCCGIPIKTLKASVYDGLAWFSTESVKLPPISVGASVDKVFVILCKPYKPLHTEIWSKNVQ